MHLSICNNPLGCFRVSAGVWCVIVHQLQPPLPHHRGNTLEHTSALLSLIHPSLTVTSSVAIAAHISFTRAREREP